MADDGNQPPLLPRVSSGVTMMSLAARGATSSGSFRLAGFFGAAGGGVARSILVAATRFGRFFFEAFFFFWSSIAFLSGSPMRPVISLIGLSDTDVAPTLKPSFFAEIFLRRSASFLVTAAGAFDSASA